MPMMHGLSYVTREPARTDAADAPVLLLLHGFATYENHLLDLTQGFDPRLSVVAVRAPLRIGPGAYRWFYFDLVPGEAPRINADEEAQSLRTLTAFVEALAARHAPKRLYLLGHSQGGTMALSIALTRPSLIAGCANVNGRILPKIAAALPPPEALTGLPFFMGHGTENPIVPIAVGRRMRARLEELGVDLTHREYPIGHEISAEALADVSEWLSAKLDEEGRSAGRSGTRRSSSHGRVPA
ncbi:alpha/beta hydrolase [Arenibaculum sp.]|uniref:alpha/beta hydrolase n=1 Tax=Arenibaculum sp. TaxID=2865862 RepID=UPI002E0E8706|nr:alpha/beta fold hydrolase [Arenibaculum sp.]